MENIASLKLHIFKSRCREESVFGNYVSSGGSSLTS